MIIKWGLQPFNLQLNFWILLCFSWLVYTDMVMADMNCSCFWPNSHNHASQHTDGNTTVSKTHSRLFKKSTTYVLQCQEWKTMLATYGSFFFFPSLFVLALESQSESQLHRPLNSISHETYSTFLLFVFSVRTRRPYLPVSHSGALCCCGFNWQPGSCVALNWIVFAPCSFPAILFL